MNDSTRKALTLFLGECWHERVFNTGNPVIATCKKCLVISAYHNQRTFTTEPDMMALYRRLWETGRWQSFIEFASEEWARPQGYIDMNVYDFTAWLFCLSDEGYEERCQMVAKFLNKGE